MHCPDGPGLGTPLVTTPDGGYFRRNGLGNRYLFGATPREEPATTDLEVEEGFFEEEVLPKLIKICPGFENYNVSYYLWFIAEIIYYGV